jgi:DNA-binding Xre family transcriptional regulator
MNNKSDKELIARFVAVCSRKRMTLDDMAASVSRSKNWASLIVNGKTKRLKFQTRNLIREFLDEL